MGKPVADYLAEKIWIPAGMEADASWWLEAPDGLEVGGSGLSARLRDYARFGLFLLADGNAFRSGGAPAGPARRGWAAALIAVSGQSTARSAFR